MRDEAAAAAAGVGDAEVEYAARCGRVAGKVEGGAAGVQGDDPVVGGGIVKGDCWVLAGQSPGVLWWEGKGRFGRETYGTEE